MKMKEKIILGDFLKHHKSPKIFNPNIDLPKISIVMPCYNHAQFIERSILSVLNQNYSNLELIIIDGDSKDNTQKIIKKYEKYIKFWISERDDGQSNALNKGFKHCTGEIYGWLNSDDIYLPNTFKHIVQAFDGNPDKKIVFGDFLSIDREDNIQDYNHSFDFNLNQFKYEGFHLNAQSMFWRSSVHNIFSGFDKKLHNTMDYQMILEFGINEGQKSFLRIPYALGGFRRYIGQKTGGHSLRALEEHIALAKKYDYYDKYMFIGKLKWLYFRFRRAWWYVKRGGISNLIYRLKISYSNHK
tara:strand:- start:1280 stop:2179 length:900 start_codon:yes stop_codon:yes gene_type:complete